MCFDLDFMDANHNYGIYNKKYNSFLITPKFNYTIEEIQITVDNYFTEYQKCIDRIKNTNINMCTFHNTIAELAQHYSDYQSIISIITFLQNVDQREKIREISRDVELRIEQFDIKMYNDMELYHRLINLKTNSLDVLQRKLLNTYLASFDSYGIKLPKLRRENLIQNIEEKKRLMIQFEKNMTEDQHNIITTTQDLEGCSDDLKKITRISPLPISLNNEDGSLNFLHRIKNSDDIKHELLISCTNPETRTRVADMENHSCLANIEILVKLHQVRQNISTALGYKNNSEYQLDGNTIDNPDVVNDLLNNINRYLDRINQEHITRLRKLKLRDIIKTRRKKKKILKDNKKIKRMNGFKRLRDEDIQFVVDRTKRNNIDRSLPLLDSGDYTYYNNQYLKRKYNVDHSMIHEYFPTMHVVFQMLDFFGEILDVTFIQHEIDHNDIWHDSILYFRCYDGNLRNQADYNIKRARPLGHFYMDLFIRPYKYNHCMMLDLIHGYQSTNKITSLFGLNKGIQVLPMAVLLCNFSNKHQHLEHSEVVTLFHEFGHVMHGICGGYRNRFACFSGTCVETDYVEAPSQMKEQWAWEPSILKRISKHIKTGEPLSDELIHQLIKSRFVGESSEWTRTVAMSRIDQAINQRSKLDEIDMLQIARDIYTETYLRDYSNFRGLGNWGHLGSYEYDSMYYSYLWTMIVAVDMYDKQFKKDPLNPKYGLRYRRLIMEPGGTTPGYRLLKKFLRRDYVSLIPFLRDYVGVNDSVLDENKSDLRMYLE